MASEESFQRVREEADKLLQKKLDYNRAVEQVKNFAGPDEDSPNWFALAKVGAAIVGLRTVEYDLVAHRVYYWRVINDRSVSPVQCYFLVPNEDFMSAI